MEQSTSAEVYVRSVGQEILLSFSLDPKVHYRDNKSPPLVLILNQMNPVHSRILYFYRIHFNITLASMSSSPK
jgi:hypothetical protein